MRKRVFTALLAPQESKFLGKGSAVSAIRSPSPQSLRLTQPVLFERGMMDSGPQIADFCTFADRFMLAPHRNSLPSVHG
jgi:hypothetical protein